MYSINDIITIRVNDLSFNRQVMNLISVELDDL